MLDTIPGVTFQVSCTRPMLPFIKGERNKIEKKKNKKKNNNPLMPVPSPDEKE
jgi:hypothetical protein